MAFNFFKKREPKTEGRAKPKGRSYRMPQMLRRSLLDQAKSDRLSGDLPTVPVPADDFVTKNQRPLVARARHLALTNDYARGFLRLCRQNIVGHQGINLQAKSRDTDGRLDESANDAIEADFRRWSARGVCDVSGKRSLRQILSRSVEDAATNGEYMIRLVFDASMNDWGLGLQPLDSQRCPVDFNVDKLGNGEFIRHGIRYNRWGRPIRFLFTTTDESESDYNYGGRHYVSLPADEIVHGYVEDLVGQRRGLPWMVTAVMRMHNLNGFEQAALVNARASAAKGGFFEWDEGFGPPDDDDADRNPIYMDASPGSYDELPPGLRFKERSPQFPSGETGPFSKQMIRGMATGLGVQYNKLANDLEGVNFSSLREGSLTERDGWKELQEWLIETLLDRIYEAWLPRALLKGIPVGTRTGAKLRPEQIEKYREHSWQARRWDWVDPDKDSKTAARDVANKFKSPSQIILERGGDPRSVWRQWAADRQAMIDAGIPEAIVDATLGSPIQTPTGGSTPTQEPSNE
jgi:lambda family phage portal protein